MQTLSAEQRKQRARIAANSRHHPDQLDRIAEDSRTLREQRLAEHITRIVNQAPPLTDDQRARLASLLVPVGGAA